TGVYTFLNKYSLNIKDHDKVDVRIKGDQISTGIVKKVEKNYNLTENKDSMSNYEPILEVKELKQEPPKYSQEVLSLLTPICLVRLKNLQWDDEEHKKIIKWGSTIKEFKYESSLGIYTGDELEIKIPNGEIFIGRIVGFNTIKNSSTKLKNMNFLNDYKKMITENKNKNKNISPEKIKFFKTKWFVIFSYIAFWPLGIFLGIKYEIFNKKIHIGMGIAILLMMFLSK
ncbi:MAG: hypothetical protein WBG30_11955, partial [Psychrilyobacter sp.]|uniref:hypothetical protein n=1 Tax=Psychrilyobacter sp. TaxID=2586924 RepID=UPI003C707240